jgi:hypothetical protein
MRSRRKEIELVYSTFDEKTHDDIMVISGHVDAVMQVAEAMKEQGLVKSYGRHASDQVRIVFDMQVDARNNLEVFESIKKEAWGVIDPRGRE